ncbi:AAA family ATPase [Ekhidna sp.]|uniref:AAA family ATPase n=1 Tax=Ekhidna sp. TaxID=2608089 RepID=UPI003516DCD0
MSEDYTHIKPIDQFLKELYNKYELKENLLAYVVAINVDSLDKKRKDRFFESTLDLMKSSLSDEGRYFNVEEKSLANHEISEKDLRLLSLRLANIKGIPEPNREGQDYGIDFSLDNEPTSMFILGSNGAGKSSLFETMEFLYTGSIGECKLREFGSDRKESYQDYLTHLNSSFKSSKATLATKAGSFNLHEDSILSDEERNALNPSTNFISAYSILVNGQLDYSSDSSHSFHCLVANSLGLQDYLDISQILNQVANYNRKKETTELSRLNSSLKDKLSNIDNWQKEIQSKQLEINNLEAEGDKAPKTQKDYSTEISILRNPISFDLNTDSFNQSVSEITSTIQKLNELPEIDKDAATDFLAHGLKLLGTHDDCPFCESSKLSTSEIKNNVEKKLALHRDYLKIQEDIELGYQTIRNLLLSFSNKVSQIVQDVKSESEQIRNTTQFLDLFNLEVKLIDELKNYKEVLSTDSIDDTASLLSRRLETFIQENSHSVIDGFKEITTEISKINQIRNDLLNRLQSKSIVDSTGTTNQLQYSLRKEIKEFEQQISSEQRSIETLKSQINIVEKDIALMNRIKSESETFSKIINDEVNKIVSENFNPIRKVVEEILNQYVEQDELKLLIDFEPVIDSMTGEETSKIITAKVFSEKKSLFVDPKKYYNTFRYKLFSTIVGLSIAIATRIQYRVNLPLLFDDVFNSGDFENKAKMYGFIESVLKYFNEYTPDLPLQMIYFTHDETLFDSLYSNLENEDRMIFSKLFGHDQAVFNGQFNELTYRLANRESLFA